MFDCLCQIIGFNGDIYGMFIFVYYDRCDVCWCYCINDELCWVIILQYDINMFIVQFGRDCLNVCVVYFYVSVDWIDMFIVGFYCDFCMRIWIVSCCFNFNYFFVDFWYFDVEQFDQYFWFGMGDEQLCVMCFWLNSIQYVVNMVVRVEVFVWQYIFMQNYCFSVIGYFFGFNFQRDIVVVYFFYYVSDNFVFLVVELIDNYCVFSFMDFLYDNLFCSLCGDMVKGDRFNLIFNIVVDIQVFVFKMCCFQCNFFCWYGYFFND